MPVVRSPNVSPSCGFKLYFCKVCDQSIKASTESKCDDCGNYFHKSCLASNQNQIEGDLIQLCQSCTNEKRVCTPKSKVELKMANKSGAKTSDSSVLNLRSRAVSIDSCKTNGKSKMKKDSQLSQTKSGENAYEKYEARMILNRELKNSKMHRAIVLKS